LLQPDAPSARQARRSALGRDRDFGAADVRARSRAAGLESRALNDDPPSVVSSRHGRAGIARRGANFQPRKTERSLTMPAQHFFADSPASIRLDPDKVQALFDRARRDVTEGVLPACQLAIARHGKIGAMGTFGRAVQGGAEQPATDAT